MWFSYLLSSKMMEGSNRKFKRRISTFCFFNLVCLVLCLPFSSATAKQYDNATTKSVSNCVQEKSPECTSKLDGQLNGKPKQATWSEFFKWFFERQIPLSTTPKNHITSYTTEGTTTPVISESYEPLSNKLLKGDSELPLKENPELFESRSGKVERHNLVKSSKSKSVNSNYSKVKGGNSIRKGRSKREPYKPIKVPYTTQSNNLQNLNNNNLFSRRQLFLNPFDQQQQAVLALQQQQAAAAAAAMLQQQQMGNLLKAAGNRNRYSSEYDHDDLDDDDDSDEDSDEFDDVSRFAPAQPLIHHHMYPRDGLPPPIAPFQRRIGFVGRRSVPQHNRKNRNKHKRRKPQKGRTDQQEEGYGGRASNKHDDTVHQLKSGQWLLDDYDLLSDFHSSQGESKDVPEDLRLQRKDVDGAGDRLEIDEEDHFERHMNEKANKEDYKALDNEHHLKYRGDMDYIYNEFKDSLCSGNECLQVRQTSSSTTTSGGSTTSGSSSSTTGGSSSTTTGSSTTSGGSSSTTTASSTTSAGTSTAGTSSTTTTTRRTTTTTATTTAPTTPPPYTATLQCRCGTQSVRGEGIGNGTIIRYHVNPWIVSISNNNSHACSGSIINDRYVLTSRQCVNGTSPGNLTVTAGLTSRSLTNFTVSSIKVNPNVNLALLLLNSTIQPSHRMRPICLPIGARYAGQYSTGTLVTFKRGPPPGTLQVIDTEVGFVNGSRCTARGTGSFCAGPPGSLRCGGDTGGVLMVYRGGFSYEQIGVVGGSVGCRARLTPGIYTDIRRRTRWILNNSGDGNYCRSPPVSENDLSSTTRIGDSAFELSEDDNIDFHNEADEEGELEHNSEELFPASSDEEYDDEE